MDFDSRMKSLYRSTSCTGFDTEAATNIYERLITAKAICYSVYGESVPPSVEAAVLAELSSEARFIMLNDERLMREGDPDPS